MNLTAARQKGRRGLYLLVAALVLMVATSPGRARAQTLNVDTTNSNTPYTVTSNITYDDENVGITTTGTINQTGATAFTNTVNTGLALGFNVGASGAYDLSIGNLSGATESIGLYGSGAFSQSGGTNTSVNLYLAGNTGASGSYSLSGGSLSGGGEFIGLTGSGAFTQSGGTDTVTGTLYLGYSYNTGASGTYTLSDTGSLSAQL